MNTLYTLLKLCFPVLAILCHLTGFSCDILCHPLKATFLTMLWLWYLMLDSLPSLLYMPSSFCLGYPSQETLTFLDSNPVGCPSVCQAKFPLFIPAFLGSIPPFYSLHLSPPPPPDKLFIMLGFWHHILGCRYFICIAWTLHLVIFSSLCLPINTFLTLLGLWNHLPGLHRTMDSFSFFTSDTQP